MERNVVPVNAASHVRAPLTILGRDFFRDYDRIVDSVFHASSTKEVADAAKEPAIGSRKLKVDMAVCEKQIEVTADLPGVDEKNVKVELRDGFLYISGEREVHGKQDGVKLYHEERSEGSFERTLTLPCAVDKSGIEASFKDGVLRVVLPKTAEARCEVMRIRVKH